MASRFSLGALGALPFLLMTACSSHPYETTRTYTDPSLAARHVSAIALFPVREAPIAESESIEMNRQIVEALEHKNPGLRVVGPPEVVETLNRKHLVEDYAKYLAVRSQTGISNNDILREVGEALGVDAIMQGNLVELQQRDGTGLSGLPANTTLTLRYSIVSTSDAALLWEISEEIRKQSSSNFGSAPRLRDVLPEAVAKVTANLPSFPLAPAAPTRDSDTPPATTGR